MSDIGGFEKAWSEAEAAIDFSVGHPLHRFGTWRLSLIGPWPLSSGPTYQAIAHPYNATGRGLDTEIEGVGGNPEAALRDLIGKIAVAGMVPA